MIIIDVLLGFTSHLTWDDLKEDTGCPENWWFSVVVGNFLCSLLSTSIACLVLFRPDNLKCLLRFMIAQNATVAIYFVSIAKVNDNLAFSLTFHIYVQCTRTSVRCERFKTVLIWNIHFGRHGFEYQARKQTLLEINDIVVFQYPVYIFNAH